MNKPKWEDAPEWAMWLAQDRDGEYLWWNIRPYHTKSVWTQGSPESDFIFKSVGYFPISREWLETLEQRP